MSVGHNLQPILQPHFEVNRSWPPNSEPVPESNRASTWQWGISRVRHQFRYRRNVCTRCDITMTLISRSFLYMMSLFVYRDAVYYVYVCDIDKPWDRYLITSNLECVTSLLWDSTGTKLLVATAVGKVQIWTMTVGATTLPEGAVQNMVRCSLWYCYNAIKFLPNPH